MDDWARFLGGTWYLSMLSDRRATLGTDASFWGENRCFSFSCKSRWSLLRVTLAGWAPANGLQGMGGKGQED